MIPEQHGQGYASPRRCSDLWLTTSLSNSYSPRSEHLLTSRPVVQTKQNHTTVNTPGLRRSVAQSKDECSSPLAVFVERPVVPRCRELARPTGDSQHLV